MEELFDKIQELRVKYCNIETYNLLDLFNINENMHSDILADMLNPNGRHKNKQFLDLFLEALEIPKFKNIKEVVVNRELPTAEKKRMDIAIYDKTNYIIIENKMHDAEDQQSQLFNYYKEVLNKYKPENIYILYLTKYGAKYSEYSFPIEKQKEFGLVNSILCISFEKEILKWLNTCKTISENAPRLFYCIEMYIELIRKTIKRDKYMEEILKHLVNNPSQMEAAIDVANALQGRNFLEIVSLRKVIVENIIKAVFTLGYTTDGEERSDRENFYWIVIQKDDEIDKYPEICSIALDTKNNNIYIQKNDTIITETDINGNDLNNIFLKALLINEQKEIIKWIDLAVNSNSGDAENLKE